MKTKKIDTFYYFMTFEFDGRSTSKKKLVQEMPGKVTGTKKK